jgi:disease resistance protein RPM1
MQSEADEDGVDHFVREWMKQLREVAYDSQDCVDLYLFRVRSRQGDRCFVRWKRLLGTLWSRRRLAGDIRALRALASAINEQHARYGVSLEPLRRTAAASDPAQAVAASARALRPDPGPAHHHHHPSNQFVGNRVRATYLANKVKALKSDDENDKQLKVFSIVGFGGLGKTTLAVEVCRQLETEFQRQAQVSVSQTFSGGKDLQGLLKRLLLQIALPSEQADPMGNIDTMDVGQLENKLKESLENTRYQRAALSLPLQLSNLPCLFLDQC